MIKAIIFDFDGVIAESVDIKTEAFMELFKKEGKAAVKKIVNHHLVNAGVSRYEKFRFIYREILNRDLTDNEFKKLCDRFASLVVEAVVRAPCVKGAKEFLDAYAGSYKCFVASATPQPEIEEIIEKRGMERYFAGIFGAPKMKTDAVKEIVRSNGLSPEEVAYVGDAMSDYEAAENNRCHFIARINNNEPIFSAIDCIKVKDLNGLKEELDKL